MKLSFWNQYWDYSGTTMYDCGRTYRELLAHYQSSSRSFELLLEESPRAFEFKRGNILVSAFALGSELWCRHYVRVELDEINGDRKSVV